jgi:peptidyl-prolyl cis-trans isomerase C
MVNGDPIFLSDFQAELGRVEAADQAAGKTASPDDQRQRALDELVNETLFAQAAYQNGFSMDDAALKTRLDSLAEQAGGADRLAEWQKNNGYDEDSFARALKRQVAALWQRDQILAQVPEEVEQIHARQIFTQDQGTADQIYQQLQSGADFATLAKKYDPLAGGELGWFPRGYLLQPEVEKAAFDLQPGQYSPVIQSAIGFHIIEVLERETRALDADAKQTLQQDALKSWLEKKRAESQINITLP